MWLISYTLKIDNYFILTGNNNVTISTLEISNPKVIALNAQVETEEQVLDLIAA